MEPIVAHVALMLAVRLATDAGLTCAIWTRALVTRMTTWLLRLALTIHQEWSNVIIATGALILRRPSARFAIAIARLALTFH